VPDRPAQCVVADEVAGMLRRRAGEEPAAVERIPKQSEAGASTGRSIGQVDASASRAARMARLLVGFLSATGDAHSVDDLCRMGWVGVGPSTFGRWCRAERERPKRVLDFARLLRALMLATTHGTSVLEWMEIDLRTFGALLRRADALELFNGPMPTTLEFIGRQRLVSNHLLLESLQRACSERERGAAGNDGRTLGGAAGA
jgi:hypothetical protein